jgi:hypothetical protein
MQYTPPKRSKEKQHASHGITKEHNLFLKIKNKIRLPTPFFFPNLDENLNINYFMWPKLCIFISFIIKELAFISFSDPAAKK